MSQNEALRADEVGAACLPGGQGDDPDGGEGEPTRVSTADQPKTGGRCRQKKTKTRPKKRSMLVRLPNSWAVQVGGRPSRRFWRLGFQGITAAAPSVVWIQAISLSPQ